MKIDKKIVEKVLNNEATLGEAQMISRWLATDEGQSYVSSQFDEEVERMAFMDESSDKSLNFPAERLERWFAVFVRTAKRKKRTTFFRQVAVWMLIMGMGGLLVYFWERMELEHEPRYAEVSTSVGERLRVAFQDGSTVLLNAQSTLKYPVDFGRSQRKVVLNGEAYFQVSKGDKRPFLVDVGGLDVKVLGTKFNVKSYPEEAIYVTLDEGSVMLNDHKLISYTLKPGDHAIYNRTTGSCQIMHPKDQNVVSAWQNNMLYFYLTPLGEILKTLERQTGVRFEVANTSALKNRFTVSSYKQDIDTILKDIETVSYIHFHRVDDNVYEVVSQ